MLKLVYDDTSRMQKWEQAQPWLVHVPYPEHVLTHPDSNFSWTSRKIISRSDDISNVTYSWRLNKLLPVAPTYIAEVHTLGSLQSLSACNILYSIRSGSHETISRQSLELFRMESRVKNAKATHSQRLEHPPTKMSNSPTITSEAHPKPLTQMYLTTPVACVFV